MLIKLVAHALYRTYAHRNVIEFIYFGRGTQISDYTVNDYRMPNKGNFHLKSTFPISLKSKS